jgi:hypothetical protein
MNSPLHQINVTYVPTEDRLLMRVTTREGDEFRIWLTRRYCLLLSGVLQKQMEKFGGAPSLASSRETKQMFKQGAMDKSFDAEQGSRYPLGESGILAFSLNAAMNEKSELSVQLLPEKGQGVTLNLNKALLYLFYNVLTQGIGQADWRIADDAPAQVH